MARFETSCPRSLSGERGVGEGSGRAPIPACQGETRGRPKIGGTNRKESPTTNLIGALTPRLVELNGSHPGSVLTTLCTECCAGTGSALTRAPQLKGS